MPKSSGWVFHLKRNQQKYDIRVHLACLSALSTPLTSTPVISSRRVATDTSNAAELDSPPPRGTSEAMAASKLKT